MGAGTSKKFQHSFFIRLGVAVLLLSGLLAIFHPVGVQAAMLAGSSGGTSDDLASRVISPRGRTGNIILASPEASGDPANDFVITVRTNNPGTSSSNPVLTNVTFSGNTATDRGDDQSEWRAYVRQVPGGEARYVRAWCDMEIFLGQSTDRSDPNDQSTQ